MQAPEILKTPRAAGYSPPCVSELDRAGILEDAIAQGSLVDVMSMQLADGTVLANNDWKCVKGHLPYEWSLMYSSLASSLMSG